MARTKRKPTTHASPLSIQESKNRLLSGVAIDQHFSQRKRFKDMTTLMKTYPQLLGIGIDEATALKARMPLDK